MATSGPGATNLVTAIADAKLDSVPLIAITGQVATPVIGTDAFQETPIVEVCRGITKHHYLVTDVNDMARVMREAFHIATTGRPGPVLIDVPKDVQMTNCTPHWDVPMNLPGYDGRRKEPTAEQIQQVAAAIKLAKRPVIYCGGGIVAADASEELREFVRKTGIPVTMTIMGLGAFPNDDPLSLDMLGMHGSVYANCAVRDCDLLAGPRRAVRRSRHRQAVGVRQACQDRAHRHRSRRSSTRIKPAHIPIVGDVKYALRDLNKVVGSMRQDIAAWVEQCQQWKAEFPFKYNQQFDGISAAARDRDAVREDP